MLHRKTGLGRLNGFSGHCLLTDRHLVDHNSSGTCASSDGVNKASDFCCRSRYAQEDRRIIGEISYNSVFAEGAQKLVVVERLDLGGEGTVRSLPDLRPDAFQGFFKLSVSLVGALLTKRRSP